MFLPRSIRGRLALLVVTVLIPIFCVSLAAAVKVYRDTQQAVADVALEAAKALSLVVDRELAVRATVLRTLAVSSALEAGELRRFQGEASKVVPSNESTIVLLDPSGQQRVNTRVPFGSQALPRSTGYPADASRGFTVSDLYMAPIGRSHSFAVRVPVRAGGEPGWHLAMGSFASQLQLIYQQHNFPQSWVSTVLDSQGRVVARSKDADRFVGQSATADMLARMRAAPEGLHETRTLDGHAVITAFSRVPGTQWNVLIGLPRAENQAPARTAFAWVMGAAMLVTAVCLLVASRIARTLADPVLRLQAQGAALGRGEAVEDEPSGLAEADAVQRELAAASRALREAGERSRAQVDAAVAQSERTQQAALAAQKQEALGRLTGGIAHDFNNLMQTMVAGLALLERSCPEGRPRAALAACQRAVQKAAQLTRQLMAFGRAQPGYQAHIDTGRYLLEMQDLLKGAVQGPIDFRVQVAPDLLPLRADPVQLELAVLNLVLNARDALKSAGRIAVRAENRTLAEGEVDGLAAGEHVALSVIDNGEGIAPEHLARIFEPFFTTKPQGKGTGLGLAQVYGFAKQHHGVAQVESAVGAGTTVTLLLPRAPLASMQEAPEAAAPPLQARHAGRVLFVEDDSLVRGVVSEALEAAGFQVLVASNAEDGLALARSRADLDIVLTDVMMPGGQSGLDLARTLRVLRPALPVVLASGYAEVLDGAQLDFPVVAKPYDPARVAEQLALLISAAARP
jgi:signal transduction histidine kinase/CheY-like chemotaxis protein